MSAEFPEDTMPEEGATSFDPSSEPTADETPDAELETATSTCSSTNCRARTRTSLSSMSRAHTTVPVSGTSCTPTRATRTR